MRVNLRQHGRVQTVAALYERREREATVIDRRYNHQDNSQFSQRKTGWVDAYALRRDQGDAFHLWVFYVRVYRMCFELAL